MSCIPTIGADSRIFKERVAPKPKHTSHHQSFISKTKNKKRRKIAGKTRISQKYYRKCVNFIKESQRTP